MNKYKEVAKIFGLDLDEPFYIDDFSNTSTFTFTDIGLILKEDKHEFPVEDDTLACLLSGEYSVKKLPYKPAYGDKYFTYEDSEEIYYNIWTFNVIDYANFFAGLVFKTKGEAEEQLECTKAKLKDFYDSI